MVAEGLLLHLGAGIEARLLAIARQRADQRRLAPADRQLQHQPVEAVVLGVADPDRQEGGLEHLADGREREPLAARIVEHELVGPDRAPPALAPDGRQLEALFRQRLQAHVVEDRQHVGERDRIAGAVELEAEAARRVAGVAEGADGDRRLLADPADRRQVGERLGRAIAVAVAGRERVGPDGEDRRGLIRLRPAAHHRLEVVVPGAGQQRDRPLEPGQVRIEVLQRRDADDVVHPRQRGVRIARVVGRDMAAERLGELAPDRLAQLRVVALARDVEQHGQETVERVVAHEELHARPVGEVQDAERDAQQLVFRRLEQLVARIGLQDVGEPHLVVAAGRQVGLGHDPVDLAPDQRHVAHRLVVGLGGEEADEAHLAARLAVWAVAAHADVVHVGAAVHHRLQVRLGDDQRVGGRQFLAHRLGEHRRLAGATQHRARRLAKHAKTRGGVDRRFLGRVAAAGLARVLVGAGAQEDEMLGGQPVEEGEVLCEPLRIVGRRIGLQLLDRAGHQLRHRIEVVDRAAHVGQRGAQSGLDVRRLLQAHRLDPDLDRRAPAGLGLDHRVEHGEHVGAGVHQLAHHAVDQEGRVGLHDLHQLGGDLGAVSGERRPDADGRRVALGALREAPELGRAAGELGERHARQLLGPIVGGDGLGERLRAWRQGLRVVRQGGEESREQRTSDLGGGTRVRQSSADLMPQSSNSHVRTGIRAPAYPARPGQTARRRRWGFRRREAGVLLGRACHLIAPGKARRSSGKGGTRTPPRYATNLNFKEQMLHCSVRRAAQGG